MHRIKLIVEYDGTNYAGWQRQINAVSVQQRLEEALSRLTKVPVTVTGASRTDAGVHALGQTVHFDTESRIPADKYSYALNTMLPADIRVRASMPAAEDFHSRFQAKSKIYRYLIHNDHHASAVWRNTRAHVMYDLDVDKMNREVQSMIGTHDFAPFAASGSVVKDTVRTIYNARVVRQGNCVMLLVHGNGFLYNMVRILAGTLISVGTGKLEELHNRGSRPEEYVTQYRCGKNVRIREEAGACRQGGRLRCNQKRKQRAYEAVWRSG